MSKLNNSNATPSKDTNTKNNNSNNDVDFKNCPKCDEKKTTTSNKRPSSGNVKGI
ncbi:MAG: hypothetical protein K0R00_3265 [Herbinix sp.]|jgi:hypothetical protein|nr:hypothetical protein [Herbinix sp.]